ncbi:hypothetical protein HWB90_gp106 [Mycobacterium phage Fowlmouth]|uniref:Uncharacterized protein n=2 Tax=Fowlmouthvirus fowlmouth TaxID=2845652 RepID=A0A7G8LPX3_9CAUD|nr:hypothetical protein HWB90_gp106 [Mycobacterium phage Fowlmouth]AYN58033.1 hypothetical protein SEA_FOWLMOUTH_84 [Mycobacterium phage Fowlmouth]QNJ59295.1 hypothetical protein SEA_MRMIYAGI_82 [Mycobacterium phage MrMiyagi]
MKERIKTFRFTCDGWYYNEHGEIQYCIDDPVTVTLTGTKDEIENELSTLGWKTAHMFYKDVEYLCPREHFEDTQKDKKVRFNKPNDLPRYSVKLKPTEELTDDQQLDRFFNG